MRSGQEATRPGLGHVGADFSERLRQGAVEEFTVRGTARSIGRIDVPCPDVQGARDVDTEGGSMGTFMRGWLRRRGGDLVLIVIAAALGGVVNHFF